nr:hypothetical protein [Tanacetum cinerariifolium]
MTTLAEFMIIASADNHPPMLEKSLYDSSKSRMELYIKIPKDGRMILNSLQNGLLVWPTVVKDDGTTRTKKYEELSGEGHIARQCTQPKRPKNVAWFKEKAMLAEAQEAGQILDEEQQAFVADPGIPDGKAVQTTIQNTATFHTEDLDAYDFDCDDISNAKVILISNLSNYGSDVISEVPHHEPYHTDMDNQNLGKHFVPQQEMSNGQAFWLQTSHLNTDQSASSPIKIEAPKELPKYSLSNNQNALEILEYFENNDLKAQLQAKDTTICKSKEYIKLMRENDKEEKVKHEMDEIETINIQLEHSVAKLLYENERLHKEIEHLKKIYKDQFDSIKKTCALSKEQCDALTPQLNSKSRKMHI